MKIFAVIMVVSFLCSCAYNTTTINASDKSTVNCTSSVDKPVDIKGTASVPASTLMGVK